MAILQLGSFTFPHLQFQCLFTKLGSIFSSKKEEVAAPERQYDRPGILADDDVKKLAFVEQRFISLFKEVASNPLDMSYMKECIQRYSESFFSNKIITNWLYGKREGSTVVGLTVPEGVRRS